MMIKKTGDLIKMALDGDFDVIVHGCNCYCNMGAGIALTIQRMFPQALHADQQTKFGDASKIGTFTTATGFTKTSPVKTFTIVNAYTQVGCNASKAVDLFEYEGFQQILDGLLRFRPDARYGFPYIGMGLAGGDPKRILPMLENFSCQVTNNGGNVTLVEFKKHI